MDIIKEQVGTESIEVHKELDRHTSDIAIEGKRACIDETHRSCVRATKAYMPMPTRNPAQVAIILVLHATWIKQPIPLQPCNAL